MTLGARLKECRSEGQPGIPQKELLRLMADSARGIDYLNGRGVQHCDIKPENILIVGGGAKICDYGLAKQTKIDLNATQTKHGFTYAYAVPEQLESPEDNRNYSDFTDQYSLATAYYHLRTGKLPFKDNDIGDLTWRKLKGKLDLTSPVLGKRERQIVAKALDSRPKNRFASCSDFVEALAADDRWRARFGRRWPCRR